MRGFENARICRSLSRARRFDGLVEDCAQFACFPQELVNRQSRRQLACDQRLELQLGFVCFFDYDTQLRDELTPGPPAAGGPMV